MRMDEKTLEKNRHIFMGASENENISVLSSQENFLNIPSSLLAKINGLNKKSYIQAYSPHPTFIISQNHENGTRFPKVAGIYLELQRMKKKGDFPLRMDGKTFKKTVMYLWVLQKVKIYLPFSPGKFSQYSLLFDLRK